jgi:hypothetical protein
MGGISPFTIMSVLPRALPDTSRVIPSCCIAGVGPECRAGFEPRLRPPGAGLSRTGPPDTEGTR